MAPSQQYDEGGDMAAYFIVTLLALVLTPFSVTRLVKSVQSFKETPSDYCSCDACAAQRHNIRKLTKGSPLRPKFSNSTLLLLLGWSLFAFLAWSASNIDSKNKVYNPFEILGIASDSPLADIKSHYKKLSRVFHPDKFKGNLTAEEVELKFIELTKAYKSLTDETIRKNLAEWGNPDGRQPVELALAIPKYLVEGKNTIWVLLAYGAVFGLGLPILVGRWWFGSREKTKDGVNARTAAAYFKSIKEDSDLDDVLVALGTSYSWENVRTVPSDDPEIGELAKQIAAQSPKEWAHLWNECDLSHIERRRIALILIFAHLLRLKIKQPNLVAAQREILLQTPTLLNSLLNIATARSWLSPSLTIMRLPAFIVQALKPTSDIDSVKIGQLPGISSDEIQSHKVIGGREKIEDRFQVLLSNGDSRVKNMERAMDSWGRLECVDVFFKVIGEKIVTPASIVYLVVKLRLRNPKSPPSPTPSRQSGTGLSERDDAFLSSPSDSENSSGVVPRRYAHAPLWPGLRHPCWWIVIADDKTNRVVVPPVKISDIPFSEQGDSNDYRAYKLQFQAPPNVGLFTWKIHVISDTFVGEDLVKDIILKIEEPVEGEAENLEDDISDPEEDSLAGQMASMRGGSIKKSPIYEEEEDDSDESGTDDDSSESSSDSD